MFCAAVLAEEKEKPDDEEKTAREARKTAGVPWKIEIRQLEASGRICGFQLRKTTR